MFNKFEMVGIGASVIFMAIALYLVRVETNFLSSTNSPQQLAQVANTGVVIVGDGEDVKNERTNALVGASDLNGKINKLVIDDIVIGSGEPAKIGDTVAVHYIGTLQDGTEFDNSRKRGDTFSFKIGDGKVIKGWEDGLVGMKVGGQRILVVPAELGYGSNTVGPIPANSTLVFAIELIEIK